MTFGRQGGRKGCYSGNYYFMAYKTDLDIQTNPHLFEWL